MNLWLAFGKYNWIPNIDTPRKKKLLFILSLSLLLAALFTFISYPGVFYSDSYGRVKTAISLSNFSNAVGDNWLSVAPQLFMALCYKITQNIALYTLLQSFFFFLSCFLVIDRFVERFSLIYILLFGICPIFYGFSVYYEMSTGCVIALNFIMLLFFSERILRKLKTGRPAFKAACCLCLFLLYFMLFGYRQNALTVIPVILFLIVVHYRKIRSRLLAGLQTGLLFLAVVLIALLPDLLGFKTKFDSSAVGMAWETVTMIGNMKDSSGYSHYLDYLGDGKTEAVLEINSKLFACPMLDTFGWTAVGNPENAKRIKQGYFQLIREQPGLYLQTKWDFIRRSMGIGYRLRDFEFLYRSDNFDLNIYGLNDSHRRMQFFNSYHRFLSAVSALALKPVWMFSVALLLLLAAVRFIDKKKLFQLVTAYILAIFYYGAFLITTESHEFRYFFPSFYLLLIVSISGLSVLIGKLPSGFAIVKSKLISSARDQKNENI